MTDQLLHGVITDEAIDLMRKRIGYPNPTLRTGFVSWPWNETASADSIRQFAHGYGDLNPLYTDRTYGSSTRWGGMIAPPGYEWTMGLDRSPAVPPDLAAQTRGALRGVHLFNAGHEGWFYRPINPGDTLYRSNALAAVQGKQSQFAGRSVITTNENTWWDESGQTVAMRRPWYIHTERRQAGSTDKYAGEERAQYTEEERDAIDAAYDAEVIRGGDALYFENVEVGAECPRMVKGPFEITDLINYFMGGGWPGYGFPALRLARENRRTLRGFYSLDDFGAWDAIMRIHWQDETARKIGVPAAYDNQILVNDSGAGKGDGLGEVVAPQTFAQIDSSLLAKGRNGFARLCIEGIKIIHHAGQDAAMSAVIPVSNTAGRLTAVHSGIKFP